MDDCPYLLVTQYDGGRFAGWQRQPNARTVQGEMERSLSRLCGERVPVLGAGRTDAGVHAHGQGAGIRLPARWNAASIRRAMNAILPDDIWICEAHRMTEGFHVRRSAISRRYDYLVGTDEESRSPFRRRFEWPLARQLDAGALREEACALLGEHSFRAFAVSGTAPAHDHHRCIITKASWRERDGGGWIFEIEANRFLHHMVRFLVGTMVSVADGRRPRGTISRLLELSYNSETSAAGAGGRVYRYAPFTTHLSFMRSYMQRETRCHVRVRMPTGTPDYRRAMLMAAHERRTVVSRVAIAAIVALLCAGCEGASAVCYVRAIAHFAVFPAVCRQPFLLLPSRIPAEQPSLTQSSVSPRQL